MQNRTIKFRVKTLDDDRRATNDWVYSTDNNLSDFFYGIEDGRYVEDSLCQFTGLKDKNGKEIYEGDIVQGDGKFVYYVEWHHAGAWALKSNSDYLSYIHNEAQGEIEVIGDIYENK